MSGKHRRDQKPWLSRLRRISRRSAKVIKPVSPWVGPLILLYRDWRNG